MYVELLSTVLSTGTKELNVDEWLVLALECRDRMLESRLQQGESSASVLANDVAYDLALINLCAAAGIGVDPERFAHPREERHRLEQQLAAIELDLNAMGRIRRSV
jgi:hypothetical protein